VAYQRSLAERKKSFMENACSTCGGGGEGDSGGEFEPGADDEMQLSKVLNKLKKKKKKGVVSDTPEQEKLPEGYMKPDFTKNMGKAVDLEVNADKQTDREKKMTMLDRARKIRAEIN